MFGLKSASDVTPQGGAAQVTLTSVEGEELLVQMDSGGVRIISGSAEKTGLVCDSVNSLLLNCSQGFVARFNQSLFMQLAAVADERRDNGEEEAES